MPKLTKPEQLTLSNGIPVILQHYDGPAAATYWWVKTGSADEAPNEAGFAHFLEHMLFKDAAAKETGQASTGQMARTIESLGGDINAYTSFDQTVYHVTCASHHWEKVIDAFGMMAKPQRFLKSDFEREREVILEELKKNEDSPGRQLFQGLFSSTFTRHPYGRPVIGFVKTLKAARVATLESFYRRNYVSGNMGLILVGPFEDGTGARKKAILKLLEKHYGERVIPKRSLQRAPRRYDEPLRKEINFVKKAFDVKTPTLSFSFRAPDLKHPDVPALDLMTGVLAMGELSRLYQGLFYGKSLVTDVSGGMYVPNDPGMLYFQAEMDEMSKIEPVAQEMFEELVRFSKEGPTAEELDRVITNAESERLYATQTADGMASRLGFLKYILGDLEFDRDYLEDLKSVDKKRIQEVAEKYFDWRRMSGSILLPKSEAKYDLTPVLESAKKIFKGPAEAPVAKAPKAKKARSAGPRYLGSQPEFITRPSGIRVIYKENPQSHVTSVHAAALGGLRLELGNPIDRRETDWGSSYMMSLTWTKGSSAHDAKRIAALVEGSAASLDGFSGRNTVGLQMTGLARDWTKLSGLFSEVLVEPTFPEDEVDHSRRVAEDTIRGIDDHSSQVCSKLFLESLFENHPYGYLTTGSMESLKAIDSAKLKAFHRAWIRPERLVLSVVGAVKPADLEHWLDELDSRILSVTGQVPGNDGSVKIPEEEDLRSPRWAEKLLGREQIHILVGGLGTTVDSKDRHTLRLLQTILGGQSGRLFIELREKKSLAYTVSPVSFEGVERGYVGTYIACSPQKRQESIDGIQKVMEQLAAKGPTASEMKRAKEFFLGRRAMDLQSDSAMAAHYGLQAVYNLPHYDDQEMIQRIEKITPKDIQAVCRKFYTDPHMVTSVVG